QKLGFDPHNHLPSLLDSADFGESSQPRSLPRDTSPPVPYKADNMLPVLVPLLIERHKARAEKNPEFIYTMARIDLNREMQKREYMPLNEERRRAEQQEFEEKLLALENARRRALGEEPLEKLEKEDPLVETAGVPDTEEEVDATKDPFLAETGHILIDLLQLQAQVAKAG